MRCWTWRWLTGALLLSNWACGGEMIVFAAVPSQPAVNQNAAALADFRTRVEAYAALHRKLEESLPKLSQEATPSEIDRHQRALLNGIAGARAAAKQGDVFTPPVRRIIRILIADTFARGNSATLRQSPCTIFVVGFLAMSAVFIGVASGVPVGAVESPVTCFTPYQSTAPLGTELCPQPSQQGVAIGQ